MLIFFTMYRLCGLDDSEKLWRKLTLNNYTDNKFSKYYLIEILTVAGAVIY